VFHGAFMSGEQLSRSTSQILLTVGIAILVGLALIEWLVWTFIARRRALRRPPVTAAAVGSKTET
jgi:hypothetical protein